jgi:KaiC/GvpD/RAD55 family RecA-like ATPase
MENPEVFPGSNMLVKGDIPPSSILLIGPTGVGKTIFCKHFLFNGLKNGEPFVFVTTNETPEEIESSMKCFGLDIEPYKEKDLIKIIDGCSWRLGKESSSEYAVDTQQNFLTAISIKIKKIQQNFKGTRFVFDSISELTALSDPNSVLNFLQVITKRIRIEGGRALFTVAHGAHDEHFMNRLRLTFDGILEMRLDETSNEIKRLLRIFSLKGARHKTNWIPFKITDKGILINSESQLRCSLCSKPIDWEPIYETFEGKKIPFDTLDCVNTYKKFKSIYGPTFR